MAHCFHVYLLFPDYQCAVEPDYMRSYMVSAAFDLKQTTFSRLCSASLHLPPEIFLANCLYRFIIRSVDKPLIGLGGVGNESWEWQ